MLSIKKTFFEVTSLEEEDLISAREGLRRTSSCPTLSTVLGAVVRGGDCSPLSPSNSSTNWADLSDSDDPPGGWQHSSSGGGLLGLIERAPVADKKKKPAAGEAARTPLRSAASLFVPCSSHGAADKSWNAPGISQENHQADESWKADSNYQEEASAPGVPQAPAGRNGGMTTVMMKNLPCGLSRKSFIRLLNKIGFEGCYDFFYLPMDFKRGLCLGYCFVNLTSVEHTQRFIKALHGFSSWPLKSEKVCTVTWSGAQGLAANIDRYQNSPVMGDQVPDHYKPVLFRGKNRIPFPKPTKQLRDIVYRS